VATGLNIACSVTYCILSTGSTHPTLGPGIFNSTIQRAPEVATMYSTKRSAALDFVCGKPMCRSWRTRARVIYSGLRYGTESQRGGFYRATSISPPMDVQIYLDTSRAAHVVSKLTWSEFIQKPKPSFTRFFSDMQESMRRVQFRWMMKCKGM